MSFVLRNALNISRTHLACIRYVPVLFMGCKVWSESSEARLTKRMFELMCVCERERERERSFQHYSSNTYDNKDSSFFESSDRFDQNEYNQAQE